jgi:hypothetical protein
VPKSRTVAVSTDSVIRMLILTVFFVSFCVTLCSPGSFKHQPTFKRKFHVKEKVTQITSDYINISGTERTQRGLLFNCSNVQDQTTI